MCRVCCDLVCVRVLRVSYGVPTMFIAELALPGFGGFDLSSLRTGIMAGANCPEATMRLVMQKMHMEEVRREERVLLLCC